MRFVCRPRQEYWEAIIGRPSGVPKSSGLPSVKFLTDGRVVNGHIIYAADLESLLVASAILGQSYPDELQAYVHCPASSAAAEVREIDWAMDTLEVWSPLNVFG